MKKYLINIVWGLMVVMAMSACSKEELVEEIKELDPTGEIAVKSEITVDGIDVTNTRAATEAGYTTGDGLYDTDDKVIVAAFANEGYELTAFYDKKNPTTNLGSSYEFPAIIPRTFKAEFRKNAEFIAVGKGGKIFISTKTSRTLVQVGTNDWNGVVSGNGKYVAVSNKGYASVSTDGRTWTTPKLILGYDAKDVTYGNGKFIAVDNMGYTTTSIDGINWTNKVRVNPIEWNSIKYLNNQFVIVGNAGFFCVSTDGNTWQTPLNIDNYDCRDVAYGNRKFVTVGAEGYIAASSDGSTWSTGEKIGNNPWFSIVYGNDKFVAVGGNSYNGYITTSNDGLTWTTPKGISESLWKSIIYENGRYLVTGENGYFSTSKDGINWTTPEQKRDESGAVVTVDFNDICAIMPPDTGKTFHFKTAEPNGRLNWWGDREDFEDHSFSYTFTQSELGYNYDYVVTHDTNHSGWRWLVDGKEVINAGQYVDLVMSPEIYDRYPDNTTFTYDLLGGNPDTETYTITVKAARWSSPSWLQDVGGSKVGFAKNDLSSWEKTIQATRGETLTIYAQGADGFHPYPNDTNHWYYKVLGFYNTGHVAYKLGAPNNGGVDSYTFTVNEGMIIYVDFQYISQ